MAQKLFVKIQYHNFEPGEFVDNQKLSFEDTVPVIRSFPWEEERTKLKVSLTNPSITFQTDNNLFLKLALYYHKKFILYFYDGMSLYTHSFFKLDDSFTLIEYFFIHSDIDRSQYKLERARAKKLNIHFLSQDFVYSTANKSFFQLMGYYTRILLILDVVFGIYVVTRHGPSTLNIILILVFFVILGGINLSLHANYFFNSRNEKLVLSKGSDSFLFGKNETPKKYFKKDIHQIIIEKNTSSSCPWNGYTLTSIEMKNGEVLPIPSIFLHAYEIEMKIPGVISKKKAVMFPFFHR